MPMPTFIVPVAIIVALIAIFFVSGYIKAPPDTAYIISGLSKKRRILIGKAGWRCPFFERVDRLSLGDEFHLIGFKPVRTGH